MEWNDFNIDASNYEFLDFGCSGGGALKNMENFSMSKTRDLG